jgi:hypothetical protein
MGREMIRAVLLLLVLWLAPGAALSQDSAFDLLVPRAKPQPQAAQPQVAPAAIVPFAPPESGIGAVQSTTDTRVVLEARLTPDSAPIGYGVTWRVFRADLGKEEALELVATAKGGTTSVDLRPGGYFIHAAFGRAGATKRVDVGPEPRTESIVLDAGGLRLNAVVGEDLPLDPEKVSFEIAQETAEGERVVIVPSAKAGLITRLAAGTYEVVSRYGGVNAMVRAQIEVTPGKLTDATLRHKGAEATLKLVAQEGGEAFANTSWTVLNEGGDTVHESVGAFPRIVLAEGTYTAIARHKDEVYSRDFTIEAGLDRDVEVRLSDVMRDEARGTVHE